ncbi:MAG: M3 family oligoendopeptidase [Candidatus Hodarchaeales archaeon]|jgi:oligoendopeptidase F
MTISKEIKWDLSIIFNNNEEARKFIAIMDKKIEEFQSKFKGKINSENIGVNELYEFLEGWNEVYSEIEGVYGFAANQLNANQTIKESLELMNTANNLATKGKMILSSFQIELGKKLLESKEIIYDPKLADYRHFLEKIVHKSQYMLSEEEEKIIVEKDRYGNKGWAKLQSEWLSSREFTIVDEGVEKKVTFGDMWRYGRSSIRETRKNALVNIVGENGLSKDKELYAATLRNICGDHIMTSKRRKYPSTFTSSLITNDVTQTQVENLIEVIEESAHLYQEFLLLKAKIMGTEKLKGEDLWAPIPVIPKDFEKNSWESAKELIIKVYSQFDEEFGAIARKIFEENHIDASPRKGKRAGAYCSSFKFKKESFILMSFTEIFGDVETLAHEMGHAVHSYMSSKKQKPLNDALSYCIAEVASEFGRFLFVDYFLGQTKDKIVKKFILFNHLETLAIICFEVGSRTTFEKSLYDAIEAGEYLDGEKISDLFLASRKKFFGEAIEFLPEQKYDWIWKPHYYRTDLRYYNYPYYYAELLVMSLYNKYKKEGEKFVPQFKEFLSAGGSESSLELGKSMGIDLESKEFWQQGIKEFEAILKETKELFQ